MPHGCNETGCRENEYERCHIAYGLTEGSPVMTQTRTFDPIEAKVSTVGKELPEIEVKVVNPDTGIECLPDEQGEMLCRGYNVMKGYYKNEAATVRLLTKMAGFIRAIWV